MDKNIDYFILEKDDPDYPESLRQIKDPPKRLFCLGRKELLKTKMVAVVGSRRTSDYGYWVATNVARRLVENNVTVVSGMANGIDSFAHWGAVNNNGNTIAVLGTGIDICFPSRNRGLYEEIGKNGLIISEYPPGMAGSRYTFPRRNRIISGLSDMVIVAEAGLQSGAFITAELANEQGKMVLAVPGNINSVTNLGNNKLICDGVMPLTVIDDIFDYLGIDKASEDIEEIRLGKDEKKVYEIIKKYGEISREKLCMELDLKPDVVNGLISVLEIKGIAISSYGKIFIAK